jgi:hypothetical protein
MTVMFGQLPIRKTFPTQRKPKLEIYFCKNNIFLAYPKNYNHFVNYYKETYQHGGISLEECIIPISILEPK